LHCYTFGDNYNKRERGSIEDIIKELKNKSFKIIYISGHSENFIDPDEGLSLCEQLFETYHTDILFTTRNVFNDKQLDRLSKLNEKMKSFNKSLYACVSISATNSYKKIEPSPLIPTPQNRMDFLKQIYNHDIYTILTIRPVFPKSFIPIKECLEIIEKCANHSSAVVASGIFVDDEIKKRLRSFPFNIKFEKHPINGALNKGMNMKIANVSEELNLLKDICRQNSVPFFTESMPALEYISGKQYKKTKTQGKTR